MGRGKMAAALAARALRRRSLRAGWLNLRVDGEGEREGGSGRAGGEGARARAQARDDGSGVVGEGDNGAGAGAGAGVGVGVGGGGVGRAGRPLLSLFLSTLSRLPYQVFTCFCQHVFRYVRMDTI